MCQHRYTYGALQSSLPSPLKLALLVTVDRGVTRLSVIVRGLQLLGSRVFLSATAAWRPSAVPRVLYKIIR